MGLEIVRSAKERNLRMGLLITNNVDAVLEQANVKNAVVPVNMKRTIINNDN